MTDEAELSKSEIRFIADMAAVGIEVRVDGARLMYEVLAVSGPLGGQPVMTGVSRTEVQNWPQVPPHWVHLPETITFPETNADVTDCPPGWKRHSRDFQLTDMSVPPALAWIRHVRGLLAIAIAAAA